jgi:hypothetical protein
MNVPPVWCGGGRLGGARAGEPAGDVDGERGGEPDVDRLDVAEGKVRRERGPEPAQHDAVERHRERGGHRGERPRGGDAAAAEQRRSDGQEQRRCRHRAEVVPQADDALVDHAERGGEQGRDDEPDARVERNARLVVTAA